MEPSNDEAFPYSTNGKVKFAAGSTGTLLQFKYNCLLAAWDQTNSSSV